MATFDLSKRFAAHVANRAYPKTLCPSEIARSLSATELDMLEVSSWRDLMPRLREMAFEARDQGDIEILQKGEIISHDRGLAEVRGPIRIRKATQET
jgi:hypothetical protein